MAAGYSCWQEYYFSMMCFMLSDSRDAMAAPDLALMQQRLKQLRDAAPTNNALGMAQLIVFRAADAHEQHLEGLGSAVHFDFVISLADNTVFEDAVRKMHKVHTSRANLVTHADHKYQWSGKLVHYFDGIWVRQGCDKHERLQLVMMRSLHCNHFWALHYCHGSKGGFTGVEYST